MQLSGVRPSVCPVRPPYAAAAGLLLWARRLGDIDCCTAGGPAASSSSHAAAACGGQMRLVPRC